METLTLQDFLKLYVTENLKYLTLDLRDTGDQSIAIISSFNSITDLETYLTNFENYQVVGFYINVNNQQDPTLTIQIKIIEESEE